MLQFYDVIQVLVTLDNLVVHSTLDTVSHRLCSDNEYILLSTTEFIHVYYLICVLNYFNLLC